MARALLGVAFALVMVATACGPASQPASKAGGAEVTAEQPLPPGVSRRVRVTEGGFYIEPSSFEVTGGETVLLEITSEDFGHTFTVSEIGLNVAVPGGEKVTQTFTVPNTPGTYKVFCAVLGHRAQGMERAFVVKPGSAPASMAGSTPAPQPTATLPDY